MNLYKKSILYIGVFLSIFYASSSLYASESIRQWSPMQVLDNFWWAVNDWDRIQDNALNDITDKQWQYASEYKISNTLDSIRVQIAPYLQWAMYIWLSLATLGIIYNGFLMVTNTLHGNWDSSKVKKRMTNIALWVWLLTWFYVIIKLILAIISYLLH
jgi:hypothetical protein